MDKMESIGEYEYSVNEMLGYGSFAVVFKGRSSKNKDFPVAIKKISKKKLPNPDLIAKEVKILKELTALRHENVVHLYDCKESANSVYLTMEFCSGGDLSDYLNEKGTLSEDTIRLFLRQVLSAIEAIHSHGIIHRDLKPQNLLLSHKEERYPPPARITIKIADFGFARFLQDGVMAATLCGTPLYMAPEVIMGNQHDGKADLWSLGTIVYQCLIGQPPFQAKSPPDLKAFYERSANLLPKIPEGTSGELKDLLKMLLKRDPNERLSFQAFGAHAFLKKNVTVSGHGRRSQPDPKLVTAAATVPSSTTGSGGLLSTTVNAISRLATTATMVTLAAKTTPKTNMAAATTTTTTTTTAVTELTSKSVPKQFYRSSPSSTSPSPYSKLIPISNVDLERNLPNSNSVQSNFSLDDDFVVVPRQLATPIDSESAITDDSQRTLTAVGNTATTIANAAADDLSPPSSEPIPVPTYRETFEKHCIGHTKSTQPSTKKPPRNLAEIMATVVTTATSQHEDLRADGAFAQSQSPMQSNENGNHDKNKNGGGGGDENGNTTANRRIESDGLHDYEPLIETIRPPKIEYGLSTTSPIVNRRHRSISLNFGDCAEQSTTQPHSQPQQHLPQSPQWTSSFGFGNTRMKFASNTTAATIGTSAPNPANFYARKSSLEPFDESSAENDVDGSEDAANGNESNENFSDLGATSVPSRSSCDRDSAFANLSTASNPKLGSYKTGAHFGEHVETIGGFFHKSASQTSLTYIPPELCEDVLFNKEHNVNLAKLNYMHALCECIQVLAKEKTDGFARTLADSSDDDDEDDEDDDENESNDDGSDMEDMGYNDEICDCAQKCTCHETNEPNGTDAATNGTDDNHLPNLYVNRYQAEQVVLNKQLVKLLSATIRFAWSQIQSKNLKQSANVMKVLNGLQKILKETLDTFRMYSDKLLILSTPVRDEDSSSDNDGGDGGGDDDDDKSAGLTKVQTADRLIYKYAIEMCRNAAVHEFRTNFAAAFKCYRIAQLLLHYLPYSSLRHQFRPSLANYMNSLQVRLGILQEKGVIYVMKKNEIDTDN